MRQIMLKTGLLLLMTLVITGLQAQKKFYVQGKGGTKSSFPLNEIRKVTLPSRTLMVHGNDGNTQSFPFIELRQARFSVWLTGNDSYNLQENKEMSLFPNPVNEELTVKVLSESVALVEIRILDMKGNTVYIQNEHAVPGTNQLKMQLSHLSKGMYICRVNKGKSIETSKFLKN